MHFLKIKQTFPIIAILLLGSGTRTEAGNRQQNVYVDLFDSSNVVSINYDSRFTNTSEFGWRVGGGVFTKWIQSSKSIWIFS